MRRSQDVTGFGRGLAAFLPQRRLSPVGTRPAYGPYFLDRSRSAAARLQSFPRSVFAHASSTGAGRKMACTGVKFVVPGATVSTARDRSVARPFRRL